MFVCIDKSCDLAQRTLCLLSIQETGDGRREGELEGGVDRERQEEEREAHCSKVILCFSLSFSNRTGNINTRIISIFVSHLSDPAQSSAQGPVTQCQQVISLLSHRPGKPEPLGGKKKNSSSLRAGPKKKDLLRRKLKQPIKSELIEAF